MKGPWKYLRPAIIVVLAAVAALVLRNANKGASTPVAVLTEKEQERVKAMLMACAFIKKHLAAEAFPEHIRLVKKTACDNYRLEGTVRRNDSLFHWRLQLRFNGSDWNNINNWAEINFRLTYPHVSQ